MMKKEKMTVIGLIIGIGMMSSGISLLITNHYYFEPELALQKNMTNIVDGYWTHESVENSKLRIQVADLGAYAYEKKLYVMETDGKSFIRFAYPNENGFQEYDGLNDTSLKSNSFENAYDKIFSQILQTIKQYNETQKTETNK